MIRHALVPVFLVSLLVFCCFGYCDGTRLDLLQGWSDFEAADIVTRWDSSYTGTSAYDYVTTWPGYSIPTANDTVAIGWERTSSEEIDPIGNKLTYKLVSSGINGSKCQYFGLKGPGIAGWCGLSAVAFKDQHGSSFFHDGDKVVFKIDQVKMSDYKSTNAKYWIRIRTATDQVVKYIDASETAKSVEASLTVTEGESRVIAEIFVYADLRNFSAQPGAYVDGAHVYVVRSGSSDYDMLSMSRYRSIKTAAMFWHPCRWNEFEAVQNYDYLIMADDSTLNYIQKIRSLNSSTKVYMYQTSDVIKTYGGAYDSYCCSSPLGYCYVVNKHPEWLYTNGIKSNVFVCSPVFTNSFYAKHYLATYQNQWVNNLMERIGSTNLDGIYIDNLEEVARDPSNTDVPITKPEIKAWDIQSFLHGTVPQLHSAGLQVIKNGCRQFLESGQGIIYMYPFWKPNNAYTESDGYTANSTTNTPNATFQEWAFFSPFTSSVARNNYDNIYWLQCLSDMDAVKNWNTATGEQALSSDQRKMLFVNVRGADSTNDPAYGLDGWLHFGLCSYLLAQNDWTVFSCGIVSSDAAYNYYADMDYSITQSLGDPTGAHTANLGDSYCRWRQYKANDSGGVGGIVVVNANTAAVRKFTVDFDAIDESGNLVPKGTKISLQPHTGRIFLQRQTLSVTLLVSNESVTPGQTVSVTVTYKNTGSAALKNVRVQVVVPDQMTYVAGSAEKTGGHYYSSTNTVVWTVSSILANGSGVRTFRAKVK